jgi:hypothetical protein
MSDINLSIDKVDASLRGSVLGTFLEHRYKEDRDAKIIITSKGSSTGLGKTTLAIIICYYADMHGWSAEEKGFVDVNEYIDKYKEVNQYSSLLIDEIEHGADARRSMAQDNVDLSHAWATLRYRNVVSVATLPSVSMLDNRMMELADIWINVVEKGKAIPFYIWTDDFSGKVKRKMLRHPATNQEEIITFPKITNADYQYMKSEKDTTVRTGKHQQTYDKDDIDKAKKEARKEKRNELIRGFYNDEDLNLSQSDIAGVVGLSQSMVGHVVNQEDD